MNQSRPPEIDDSSDEPVQDALRWSRFDGVEGMQAAAQAEGWAVDYRQIAAGTMVASSATADCAGIGLMDERVSSPLEAVGETPEGHVAVTLPLGSSRIWINGKWSTGRGFYLSEPGGSFHSFAEQHARALTMHVPISLLTMATEAGLDSERSPLRDGWVETSLASATRLKQLVRETTHRLISGPWQVEQASALVEALSNCIDGPMDSRWERGHLSQAERLRVIRCAREFVDAHLAEPIRIGELAEFCTASISKIERTFRQELQMSPRQYIRARRLAEAHRALKSADSEGTTVARVATDHGFPHLGRFAGAYRAHFGELPSETLGSS